MQYNLINLMEEMVTRKLDETMAECETCNCDLCRKDVLALTLNSLPPHYTVRDSGNVLAEHKWNSQQGQAEIITAIMQAIKKVKAFPRHEDMSIRG